MNIGIHLRHLRRLWGLPTDNDRLHVADESIMEQLALIRREQSAYSANWNDLVDLLLRRLAQLSTLADCDSDQSEKASTAVDSSTRSPRRGINDRPSLTAREAALINRAEDHGAYLARSGLWVNEPVTFLHTEGSVTWAHTNERIVELPFVLQSLATVPQTARILDVGSCESLLPLYLSSIGYEVTALDFREYGFSHPRLNVVRENLTEWKGDAVDYDAVTLLATLEHNGLTSHGGHQVDLEADYKAMSAIRKLLKPGGKLILTAPFGHRQRVDLERTYSSNDLARLMRGYKVHRCAIACRLDEKTWTTKWDIDFDQLKSLDTGQNQLVLIDAERIQG